METKRRLEEHRVTIDCFYSHYSHSLQRPLTRRMATVRMPLCISVCEQTPSSRCADKPVSTTATLCSPEQQRLLGCKCQRRKLKLTHSWAQAKQPRRIWVSILVSIIGAVSNCMWRGGGFLVCIMDWESACCCCYCVHDCNTFSCLLLDVGGAQLLKFRFCWLNNSTVSAWVQSAWNTNESKTQTSQGPSYTGMQSYRESDWNGWHLIWCIQSAPDVGRLEGK